MARKHAGSAPAVLKEYLEHGADVFYQYGPDRLLTYVSPGLRQACGCRPQDVLGKTWSELAADAPSAERAAACAQKTLQTGARQPPYEFQFRDKSGAVRWLEMSEVPVSRRGRVAVVAGSARDMTQRMAEIERMERELRQMQNIESLGLLAGGIAHDFNNMLTAIMGNISLARIQLPESHPVAGILSDAIYASHGAQTLARQLLTFARGGQPVKRAFLLADMVRHTAVFATRGSNAKCVFDLPDELWPVEGDEGHLQQVVHNLVLNAMQAMPDGGRITISAANENLRAPDPLPLGPGRYVKLTVQDQGVGIPAQYLGKVFDPYFTTKGKGWGLGLSMVYSVVRKHGGHVAVESYPDSGSRFHVYLPAAAERPAAPAEAAAMPPLGHGRILVMDDEDMVNNILCLMLKRLGYCAQPAHDGAQALKLYEEARAAGRRFDAVIMDLTISGGMGGKEAAKRLRRLDPRAKVIVTSGYANDPILSDYSAHGFDSVLLKPYQFEDLARVLSAVLPV